jgi:chromosome partitioning protein|tara:strand:- start:52 stop:924 length:873 start_codon:yes stop_codon:yes gene_type:complete
MATEKAKIITLVCNKGGVGRSTTTINTAWRLAEYGKKVLVVDLDAQCNTSMTLAGDYVLDVYNSNRNLVECIGDNRGSFIQYKIDTRHPNLSLLGATIYLDETEDKIKSSATPTHILQSKLDEETLDYFDYIFFDTPPSKHNKLLHNALVVSDYYWYIIGAEDIWALDARNVMDQVIESIKQLNENLQPLPVLITKFRSNVIQCKVMFDTCQREFASAGGVMNTTIRFTTYVGRSEAKRQSLYEYSRKHAVCEDYSNVCGELNTAIHGSLFTQEMLGEKRKFKKKEKATA